MQQTFQRTAYLTLGTHRSGAWATEQLLDLAGAELLGNVTRDNEHGYFSAYSDRLHAAGGPWGASVNLPHAPLKSEAQAATARVADRFKAELGEAIHPLLKDPHEVQDQQIRTLARELATLRQERAQIAGVIDTALAGR
ncbi:MAG: hypothetical protein C0481_02650 [Phenylobacterium sp.]|uniref:hypothetical protein n=1 Tax=Phenylobacterium sp. TaxID=1871053 RepID=UPI0025CFECC4|nr:hypothetical protein [Phenylobacterium sp.]MBA4010743.1 hypothetical protein [Phenylobacterium sp.]